jgi:hypothetical protein
VNVRDNVPKLLVCTTTSVETALLVASVSVRTRQITADVVPGRKRGELQWLSLAPVACRARVAFPTLGATQTRNSARYAWPCAITASSPSPRAIALPGTTTTTFPESKVAAAPYATWPAPDEPDWVSAAAAPCGASAKSSAAAPKMVRGFTFPTLRPTVPELDGNKGNTAGRAGK